MTQPVDLLALIGQQTQLKKAANVNGRGPEYAGACPFCGGRDRLRVQPEMGLWWCRQCSPDEHWSSAADYVMRRDNVDFKTAMQTLGLSTATTDETWDYHDTDGTLIYQVVRYRRGGEKSYFQRTPDHVGGWIKGLNGVAPTLYRLPEVLRAAKAGETIYIVEGEKCADALRRRGLVATTNSGGAGKWRATFAQHLAGAADVVILADNDAPGAKHAADVLRSVRPVVSSARVVAFPDLPPAGDVADWLALGHTVDELAARCAPAAVAVVDAASAPPAKPVGQVEYVLADWRQHGITAADLFRKEFAPLYWTVENIGPEGALLLAGKPKSRKSWAALAAAVACALGEKVFGKLGTRQGRVLYLDLESNQRRMRGRLFSMLGHRMKDLDNLHIFTQWPRGEEGLQALEQWVAAYPDTVLIIIDVLGDFRRSKDPKEDPYAYDRETVQPLNAFAERHRLTLMLVHHTRKAKADDVFDEVSGSTGLVSAVATTWILGRAPNGENQTILTLRGRDLINDEPLALEWDDYDNSFKITGGAVDANLTAERRAVLKVMADDCEWGPKEIAIELNKPVTNVKQLLKALLSEGLIERTGYGKYVRVLGRDHSDHSANSSDYTHSAYSSNMPKSDRKSERVIDQLGADHSSDHSFLAHQDALNSPENSKSDQSDRTLKEITYGEVEYADGSSGWVVWEGDTAVASFKTEAEAVAEAERRARGEY